MGNIVFRTPNSRRQAADWLQRRDIQFHQKLLSLSLSDPDATERLEAVKDSSILVLPALHTTSHSEILWSANQIGAYGKFVAELSIFSGKYFYYTASLSRLVDEIRLSLYNSNRTGIMSDSLKYDPVLVGDTSVVMVSKKKGVKVV